MPNPIQRIVRLVLDKRAAAKAESEAKKNLKGIDHGLAALKKTALAVGAAMATAFGVRALSRFLKDSAKVGAEAQAIWNRLGQAVRDAGVNYQAVEQDIHRTANAMQAATKVGDEEFALILTELLTTSHDYAASIREVGTVIDLATAKQIDMKSAAMLVGRAMVGQTATLTRYGIVVKQGQDAMEVLRDSFRGFAVNEAQTFQGKLTQLNNAWDDFKQAIGEALIAGADGKTMLDQLTGAVQELTHQVDIFSRRYGGVNEQFFQDQQALQRILSAAKTPEQALKGLEVFRDETQKQLDAARESVDNSKNAWLETLKAVAIPGGPEPLSVFSRIRTDNKLTVEEVQGLQQTLEYIQKLMTGVKSGAQTVGTTLPPTAPTPRPSIASPTARTLPALGAIPKEIQAGQVAMSAFNQVMADMNHQFDIARTLAEATGDDYASLNNQAQMLTNTMQILAEQGIGASDRRMIALSARLDEIRQKSALVAHQQRLMGEVGQATGEILNAAFGAGIGQLAASKAKQNAILALEQTVQGFVASLNPFTAPLAGAHYAAATQFAGIAAAWGALAAATGGFSGGGGGAGVGGYGGGGAGGQATRNAQPAGPELNVYFTGEGFSAVNPKVQRVVYTALQAAQDSIGGNARVRLFRGNIPQGG